MERLNGYYRDGAYDTIRSDFVSKNDFIGLNTEVDYLKRDIGNIDNKISEMRAQVCELEKRATVPKKRLRATVRAGKDTVEIRRNG